MVVPTPTFEDLDLSDGWSESGNPQHLDDQHTLLSSASGDGVGDKLSQSGIIAADDWTVSIWFRFPSTASGTATIYQQAASTLIGQGSIVLTSAGKIQAIATDGTTGANRTQSVSTSTYKDNKYHLATIRVRLSALTVDILVDGVEVAYDSQNVDSGTGYPGNTGTLKASTLLGNETSPDSQANEVSRLKIWNGTFLSDVVILEEFNNEFAAARSFINVSEDSRWDWDQLSGDLLDKVGARDGAPVNIITERSGVYWHVGKDPDFGAANWPDSPTGRLFDFKDGASMLYHMLTIQVDLTGQIRRWLVAIAAAGANHPAARYNDITATTQWEVFPNGMDGHVLAQSRQPKIGETYALIWMYDPATKLSMFKILSDDPTDPIDLYSEFTNPGANPAVSGHRISVNPLSTQGFDSFARKTGVSGYATVDTNLRGSKAMMFKSATDLIENFILTPSDGDGGAKIYYYYD